MKRLLLLLTLLATFGLSTAFEAPKAAALSGSEFQAGRIIDDGVFFNGNGLDANQIQAFLNAKVPVCNTNHARTSSANDSGPPYTCMKDFRQDTWNIPGDAYCNGFSQGNKSAAQIIYEVGQSCGVSQKVILVTLQKEQSLVTDDWPWNIQYNHATGYACPDTAPCDPDFEGFFRQVYYGARQFKRYAKDSHIFTSYRPFRENYIQYNPNGGCGGTNIYVQNQATSGLYVYTPYQPNAAALSNLYGTGDGCSAYGNRNFWRMFTDWFGTTYAGPYFARVTDQSPSMYLLPGQSASVYVRIKNAGNEIWYDDVASGVVAGRKPVRLATDLPLNNNSPFSKTWAYPNRPGVNFSRVYNSSGALSPDQHQANPGESVEFWYAYSVPHGFPAGSHALGFRPVIEGLGAMNDTGSYFVVNVIPAVYSAAYAGQSSFPSLKQGETGDVSMSYKNTGNVTWHDDVSSPGSGQLSIHLATDYPLNHNSNFSKKWPYPHRAAVTFGAVYESNGTTLATNQNKVQPGQIAKFNFKATVPTTLNPGFYGQAVRLVAQGLGPLNDTGTWFGVNVQQAVYSASYAGQSGFATIPKSGTAAANMRYKNTGNITWYDDSSFAANNSYSTHLATDKILNRASTFGSMWPYPHRAAVTFGAVYESNGTTLASIQNAVAPGQIAQFNFTLKVPSTTATGFYGEGLRPVVQGFGPMNDVGTWAGINVTP